MKIIRFQPFDYSTPEGRSSERYRRIALNTLTTLITRVSGLALYVVLVPVLISYLGEDIYGLWTAITSLSTWLILMDFGLLKGLVNAVSEAYGKDDREAAASYVSTAFISTLAVVAMAVAGFLVILPHIPWYDVFAVRGQIAEDQVVLAVAGGVIPFIVAVPLAIARQVYSAYQRQYVADLFDMAASLITLVAVLIAVNQHAGLPLLLLLFTGSRVAVLFASLLYLFGREMPWLAPRPGNVSLAAMRRLLAVSVPLLLFQFGALFVNQSQPIIIAHRADLGTVGEYAVLMTLYVLSMSIIRLPTNSFVPAFREAHERGDVGWVRLSFKKMLLLRMGIASAIAFALLVAGNRLLGLWLGSPELGFTMDTWALLGALIAVATWSTAFSDFLTIMDQVWVQVGLVSVNGLVVVGLTYLLVPLLGISGALAALCVFSLLVQSWFLPRAARHLLR